MILLPSPHSPVMKTSTKPTTFGKYLASKSLDAQDGNQVYLENILMLLNFSTYFHKLELRKFVLHSTLSFLTYLKEIEVFWCKFASDRLKHAGGKLAQVSGKRD